MKSKLVKTFAAGLAAILLSSCSPNLSTSESTPEDTVKTFFKEIKGGRDPLVKCGYTEMNNAKVLYLTDGGAHHKQEHVQRGNCNNNPECYKNRYDQFIECADDLNKCIQYNGEANVSNEYKETTRMIVLSSGDQELKFILQKESDKNWKIVVQHGPR